MPDQQVDTGRGTANGARPVFKGQTPDADILAGLDALPDDAPVPGAEAAPKLDEPADESEVEAKPDADEPDDDVDAEVEAEKKPTEKPDKDLDRRLEAVRKEKKRDKEELTAERREFSAEREKYVAEKRAHDAEKAEFAKLKANAKRDPMAVLAALGLTDEDAETVSRAAWLRTAAAKADPKNRAAVEAALKQSAGDDRMSKIEAELAETKRQLAERDTQSRNQQMLGQYLDGVSKAATDEHPLLKSQLAKNPEKARRALHQIAVEITDPDDSGKPPDAADVVAEYERRRLDELSELGIDYAAIGKPKADEKPVVKPSKTLGSGAGRTAAKPKQTNEDIDAEILREIEEMQKKRT